MQKVQQYLQFTAFEWGTFWTALSPQIFSPCSFAPDGVAEIPFGGKPQINARARRRG